VNFENFTQLLSTVSISLKVALGAAVLALMGLSYALGFSHADQPKEVVCALELSLVDTFKARLSNVEREVSDKLQAAQMSCVQREQEVCSGRIEKFSERLEKIRCKICNRKKRLK